MKTTEQNFRDRLIVIYSKRERLFKFIFRLALSLLGFLVLANSYGYMGVISTPWVPVALGIICGFLPLSATSFVMFLYMCIQLFALSIDVLIGFFVLCLIVFLISKAFGAKSNFHIMYMTVFYRLSVPFLGPLYEGFFGTKREIVPVLGGAAIAFYLRMIRLSAAGLRSDENQNAFTMLRDNVLSNTLFYVLLIAIAAMFLIIYIFRKSGIRNSWLYATVIGVVVEFIIMIAGFLIMGNNARVLPLIIGNIVTLAAGLIFTYIFGEIRYHHQKELDFEDDEYYYHVVCTPKLRVEDTSKKVTRITRSPKEIEMENQGEELPVGEELKQDTRENNLEDS